jgi:hypothetical protein
MAWPSGMGMVIVVLLDEATILDLVETTKSSINPRQLPLFSLGSYFKDIFVGLSLMGKV